LGIFFAEVFLWFFWVFFLWFFFGLLGFFIR